MSPFGAEKPLAYPSEGQKKLIFFKIVLIDITGNNIINRFLRDF